MFGTDGIRGIHLGETLAFRVGRALATLQPHCRILTGRDTRSDGYDLLNALNLGCIQSGAHVECSGITTSPQIAMATRRGAYDFGVEISASHNPPEYNGIKIFDSLGLKLCAAKEAQIQRIVETQEYFAQEGSLRCVDTQAQYVLAVDTALKQWLQRLSDGHKPIERLKGVPIVVDCANGAAYRNVPAVLRAYEMQFQTLCDGGDGEHINVQCGALFPERVAKAASIEGAWGVALDGDGDRLAMVLPNGRILNGHEMLYCLAKGAAVLGGQLHTLVSTILLNHGVSQKLEKYHVQTFPTSVGDRMVAEGMMKTGTWLGGEPSGHILFAGETFTADGLIAALALIVLDGRIPLEKLLEDLYLYPQAVRSVEGWYAQSTFAEIEQKFMRENHRIVLRNSGTEHIARIAVEGEDAEEIASAIEKCLKEEAKCVES